MSEFPRRSVRSGSSRTRRCFRAELEAQLRAVTAKPVVIPVTAAVAAGTAQAAQQAAQASGAQAVAATQTAAATNAAAKAQQAGAAAAQQATSATAAYAHALDLNAVAANRLAGIEEAMSLTTTELAASRVRLQATTAAAATSEKALQAAISTGNVAFVQRQVALTAVITGTRQLAVADVQAAIAEHQLEAAQRKKSIGAGVRGQGRRRDRTFAARCARGDASGQLGVPGRCCRSNRLHEGCWFCRRPGDATRCVRGDRRGDRRPDGTCVRSREGARRRYHVAGCRRTGRRRAMTTLAKAGLSVEDAMTGAKGTLQLATAAEIENAEAAQITASALNAFGLAGTEAVHVADLLTGAANASQASITEMGDSLRQAAAVTNLVGISLEDTVALLSLLAKNGIQGSDAGTSLRTAIIRLINPTEKARTEISKLNLVLRDSQGALRPDIFAQFERATRDLTAAERDRIRAVIFGQDAIRASGVLGREGIAGLNEQREATDRAGETQRIAAARTEGLSGKLGQLRNNAESAGLTLGEFFKPGVENFVDALNATFGPAVDDFSQQLNTIGADWQKTRDILSQPIDTNLGDIVSDLGFLTEIANRFTERGLEVPADIQAGIDRLGEALDLKLTGALGRADESALAAQKALAALGETADKTGFKIADLGSRLQRNIAVAAARGDEGAELAGLRRVEQRQQAFLDRILARPQTQANVELAEKAAANLEATRNRIQSILDGQAADAEAARADARKARDRADDALINILVGEERQARDRALRAAGTEGLRDDLRANAALQTILQRQIEVVRARVKDQDRANQIIAGLVTEVIGLGNERKDILRRMAEAEREAAEARFERMRHAPSC